MRSGYDDEYVESDWTSFDCQIADEVIDKTFTQTTFHVLPSLRSRRAEAGWVCSKPYHGGEFDATEWAVVSGGWDHEHCTLCFARIVDDMTYWANGNEVVILCDRCFDHYRPQLHVPA
jgi:hypothetical protein